ncbi:hypothetical protein Hdeb2414_s0016g00496271 [Helianthus debilis subsp. tardiflorus]
MSPCLLLTTDSTRKLDSNQTKPNMVKLATARECRMYGPGLTRNRAEYMNAGVYVFSTIMLICGFVLLLARQPQVGLVMLLIGLTLIVAANVHDLIAHLAGIDYRIGLMELDIQLPLVEVAVPVVQALGGVLFFLGILFLLIQVLLQITGSGFEIFNRCRKRIYPRISIKSEVKNVYTQKF